MNLASSFKEQIANLVRLQVNLINLIRIVNDRVETSNFLNNTLLMSHWVAGADLDILHTRSFHPHDHSERQFTANSVVKKLRNSQLPEISNAPMSEAQGSNQGWSDSK